MNAAFEKAFSDFLDRQEYDDAENALFSIVRIAFAAGWHAASGHPVSPQRASAARRGKAIETDIVFP